MFELLSQAPDMAGILAAIEKFYAGCPKELVEKSPGKYAVVWPAGSPKAGQELEKMAVHRHKRGFYFLADMLP